MKAIKVDIKKELIDMPKNRGVMNFANVPPINVGLMHEGQLPPSVDMRATETTYVLQRVHNPYSEEKVKHYLVKPDDKEMFTELIEVHRGMIESALAKAKDEGVDEGKLMGIDIGTRKGKRAVWSLPWYKRLFKIKE